MLESLSIKNIVLINSLNVEMEKGLCVLTGETGSGKSILLDALGLATGTRSSARLLRAGEKQGSVVAEFNIVNNPECQRILAENDFEPSDNLILRRILYDDGRSKAFVNDTPVGQVLLDKIGDSLLEVHGQHEQRGLMNPSKHRDILDDYAGLKLQVSEIAGTYDEMKKIANELQLLKDKRDEAIREQDYLQHICNELETLNVQQGEEELLAEKRQMLMNKEKIFDVLNFVRNEIEIGNDVQKNITSAQNTLMRAKGLGEGIAKDGENKFEQIIDSLEKASIEIGEVMNHISETYQIVGSDDENLEEVEERLFAIRGLCRKFNLGADDLPAFLDEMQKKLNLLANQEVIMGDLEGRLAKIKGEYKVRTNELTAKRRASGEKLSAELMQELAPLKMGGTKFAVEINELSEESWTRHGANLIRFIASTNPGNPMSDLSKIASGGELSRFMLGLKVVLSKTKSVPTLIFDEIDTGIGGAVADAVGERLKLLGQNLQVMVVTHHPQVASKGNYHLLIKKEQQENFTNTMLDVLSDVDLRKKEIARMLAGDIITDEAVKAAERLLGE
jgi:DNA repair protein RecN (Recombination protein N)